MGPANVAVVKYSSQQTSGVDRYRIARTVLAVGTLAVTAGCGSGGSNEARGVSTTAASPTTATAVTTEAPTSSTTTPPTDPPQTSAPAPTVQPPTTAPSESMASSIPPADTDADGNLVGHEELSSDGLAKMTVGDDWKKDDQTQLVTWILANNPQARVLLTGDALEGISTLAEYADSYEKRMANASMETLQSGTLTGSKGQELAFFEFRSTDEGQPVHLVAYLTVAGGTGARVMQSAPEDQFAEITAQARPYLETIEVVQ